MNAGISDPPQRNASRLKHIALANRPDGPRVVAVDGRAGSGKTTFAGHLAEQLGPECVTIHMDDLYAGWQGLAEAPSYLVDHILAALSRGEAARYEPWDWHRHRRGAPVEVAPSAWIVVEGVGSGAGIVRPYLAALAWLEADEAIRKRRGLGRDGDMFRPHWDAWAGQEADLLRAERTPEHADLVIRT